MREEKNTANNIKGSLLADSHQLASAHVLAPFALALSQSADASNKVARLVRIALISLILAVGTFYVTTIRAGHEWGDDFSLYILHAKNLVEGVRYEQTGYIYNPALALLGPQTYPPVFPVLLTPIYKLWHLNLTAMKIEVIVIFLLSLLTIFACLKTSLPWPYLLALVAIVGFNPFIWQFKDNIVSDLPFVLFVYLSLFLIHSRYQVNQTAGSQNLQALLLGLVLYLAYGTRSIGIVLVPSLLIIEFIKNKKLTAFALKTVLLTGTLIVLQSVFLHSDRSYAGHIGFSLITTVHNALDFTSEFSAVVAPVSYKVLRLGMFAAITGLAMAGCFSRLKERITVFEVFLVLYLIPLLILPMPVNVRFLLPIMPIYLLYVFLGIRTLAQGQRKEGAILLFLLIAIFASYGARFASLDYGPIRDGIAKKEAQELFDYVKNEMGQNDVLIFRRPRALALFTGHKAAAWHQSADDQSLWNYFRQINATHLVIGPKQIETEDQEYFGNFIARHRDQLQETFSNEDFHVYRIKDRR